MNHDNGALGLAEPKRKVSAQPEFLDRHLNWLEFTSRVLHEAVDARTPLLERVDFLGIFTSILDEFFMKRGEEMEGKLGEIHQRLTPMLAQQERCFREEIRPALAEHGIHLLSVSDFTPEEAEAAGEYYRRNVFPVLTPQLVDPSHPFPFISNLSDSLAVALRDPHSQEKMFARVKVPHVLPQWFQLEADSPPGQWRFASLRDMILHNLPHLFPGMVIENVLPLRVTRSASVEWEETEKDDMLEVVEAELRRRRMLRVVRLEHGADPDHWLLDQVVRHLNIAPQRVFEMPGELDYTDFGVIASLSIPRLKYSSWTSTLPVGLSGPKPDIFARIRSGDVLVHHPYESFDASVSRFIRAAVEDDNVLAVKMTVYRTSDDAPFVPWLIKAAESGKQVACLVELKARLDENRNIRWANALEDAGVHVVYGVMAYKVHCKMALIVRREEQGGLCCYAHIGTGNYNSSTAKLYTDLGLFTCKKDITEDVVELFHYLTGRSQKDDYRKLLVAPVNMKERFLEMIRREMKAHRKGRPAGIIAKMNQLEDRDVCRALYEASQAGLPIDLIIRGFCVLRPGVPELSPTIRVISVIGRFLEHSRICYFRAGAEDPIDGKFYIGSADWMHRNLEDRIEAMVPIEDRALRARCWDILQTTLTDHRQAWEMQPDGSYRQRTPAKDAPPIESAGSHQLLMDEAVRRNGATAHLGDGEKV